MRMQIPLRDQAELYELPLSTMDVEPHPFMAALCPWLDWAKKYLGQKETGKHGRASNPFIVNLFNHTHYHTKTDQTPWCAAFVSTALESMGYKSAHSASAYDYKSYGERCEVKPGAVVVFKWPSGGGHVAFIQSVSSGSVACLGGNQGDSVKVSVFGRENIVATRWPVK